MLKCPPKETLDAKPISRYDEHKGHDIETTETYEFLQRGWSIFLFWVLEDGVELERERAPSQEIGRGYEIAFKVRTRRL